MKILCKTLWIFAILNCVLNILAVLSIVLPLSHTEAAVSVLIAIATLIIVYLAFLSIEGIIGAALTVFMMIKSSKVGGIRKSDIILLALYILFIPLGWLWFNVLMSV